MPKTITKYPAGFLSLLGVQSDGRAPNELSDVVQPILDLAPFLIANTIISGSGVTAALAATGSASTTSPLGPRAGLVWILDSVSVVPTADLGAATTITYQPMIQQRGVFTPIGTPVTSTVGQRNASVFHPPRQMLVNPGDDLGVWVGAFAGLGTVFSVVVRVTPVLF